MDLSTDQKVGGSSPSKRAKRVAGRVLRRVRQVVSPDQRLQA